MEFHRENRTHRAEKPDVELTVYLGPMPPDASDSPGGIPAYDFNAPATAYDKPKDEREIIIMSLSCCIYKYDRFYGKSHL